MDRDPLTDILRRADAAAAAPAGRADVAGIVRRRFDRRRRRRRAMAAMATMIVVGFGTVWVSTASRRDDRQKGQVAVTEIAPPPGPSDVAALRDELAGLQRDGDAREAVVRRVMLESEGCRAAKAARREDPLDVLRWQREQAALVLVRQGDRLADDLDLPQPAAVAYRRASETFPDTHWGAVARARLTIEH